MATEDYNEVQIVVKFRGKQSAVMKALEKYHNLIDFLKDQNPEGEFKVKSEEIPF